MSSVKNPADLLSAVPFLLGYHPENSLVVISIDDDYAMSMAMRLDFPKSIDQDALGVVAQHLVKEKAVGSVAVAYAPTATEIDPAELLNSLGSIIAEQDIEVRDLILVQDGKWRSLICQDETCCPKSGNDLPDFKNSEITAEQVAKGNPLPYQDINSLVASLDANELSTDEDFIAQVKSATELTQIQQADIVKDFADRVLAGKSISVKMKAQVIGAVVDIQVRDFALGAFNNSDLARSAFIDLVKSAPKGFISPVASLAGAYAYENGEGALAHRLLDKAIADDADYTLCRLLRRVFSSGWPPSGFQQLRAELHGKVVATIYGVAVVE